MNLRTTQAAPAFPAAPGERRPSLLVLGGAMVALVAIGLAVAWATATGRGIEVAAVSVAAVGVLVSLRWPLAPLFAIAVFIPFEEAINIEGLGTLGRYAEILFIVVYGIPRLGRLDFLAMPGAGWGFVVWGALSAGWAIDSATTWTLITPLALEFATAVLIANAVIERPAIVRPILWAYSLAAAGTALLAIVNVVASGGIGALGDRAVGFANQDPAHFAAILVPALIFGFYELVEGQWLIPSATVVLLSSIGIVLSGTRSAWFAVVVVFALFVIPRLERRRQIVAILVVASLVLIVSQIPGVADLIGERTDTALSTGGAGRTDIWTIGLAIFASAPWIGVGLANFAVANTPEAARQALLPITSGEGLANFAPHNIYVGTLGELGVIGIILMLAFLLPLVFRRGWGRDGTVVQAALAALLVIGVFLDILNRKELWLFVGLACGLTYLAQHVRPTSEAPASDLASTDGP